MHIDWAGIAVLISALAAAFVSVGTFIRQGAMEKKLTQVHELVNGVSHELIDANKKVAFSEGEKAGAIGERADVAARQPTEGIP